MKTSLRIERVEGGRVESNKSTSVLKNYRKRLQQVSVSRRTEAFFRLYELYCHELAPLTGMRPDRQGRYGDASLEDEVPKDKNVELWLASDPEGPVGFLWLERTPGKAWTVDQLYVLPACRRSGLAAELVRHGFARHPGAWEIFVLDNNAPALAFWRRLLPSLGTWTESVETRDGRPGVVWTT